MIPAEDGTREVAVELGGGERDGTGIVVRVAVADGLDVEDPVGAAVGIRVGSAGEGGMWVDVSRTAGAAGEEDCSHNIRTAKRAPPIVIRQTSNAITK